MTVHEFTEEQKTKITNMVNAMVDSLQDHIIEPYDTILAHFAISVCRAKMTEEIEELREEARKVAKERGIKVNEGSND